MKLDRGNPNLMKRAALRVNPRATLESFTNTLGDKVARKHRATVGFVPMPRAPDVVPPATNSLWAQPVYTPPKNEYVRPGAEDHLRYKSRGL
jgi:hypothetical protein